MISVAITRAAFSPEAELAGFAARRDTGSGALASFIGYCRNKSADSAVEQLELDHYPGFTEREVERMTHGVGAKHGVGEILVIHRVGTIAAGEAIVLVAVASAHRAAAFAAAEELMDRLKTDAPFWKRELGPAGARWIEPTAQDYARREEHEE